MPQVLVAVKAFITYVGAQVAVGLNIAAGVKATMAIGGAVIAGAALAAKKVLGMLEVSMPKVDTDASRQSTVKSTTEPYKIIYGETLVSGPIFWAGTAGTDNQDLYYAIALAGHEVESITDIHFDNVVIPNADINSGSAAGGAVGGTGTFSPKGGSTIATINKHKGESTQTADSLLTGAFSSKWTSAHRARGIAYIVTKWTLNEDSAETWDKFTPSNIMAKVKGRKIYDPRKDSTSSAYDSSLGVSDHRFTDPSTWDWSDNPALCLADYLTAVDFTDAGSFIVGKDYRIESVGTTDFTAIGAASNAVGVRFTATGVGTGTGKASRPSFGMGIVESKIDWDAVATAADGCDATVNVPDSATEKRFTANGVVFGTDSHRTNIDKILSAMNGNLTYVNGKYVVRAGIYEAHTVDLDEDDLIDGVSVKTSLERGDRFNTVKGLFLDPDSNNKTVEFPKVQLADALSRDNNEELHKEIALNMTNSSYMAQRIANKLIQLSDQQKVIVFPANMSAVRVSVGDRVRVTIGDLSFSNKVFQCIGWTFNEEGGVNLTLREDASTAYADPLPGAYSTVSATGTITDGFRGVPGPSGLRGVSGEDKVFLDWVNPGNPQDFETIHVFAGTNNDFDHANTVKVGETDGSQFTVESKTGAGDGSEFSAGNTRYFWVRAIKFKGTSSEAQSGTHPGTTQGVAITIAATAVDWSNVANPTIGLDLTSDTVSIVYDSQTTQTGQGISQSGIGQGVSVASGGITMTTGGAIKGGQTAFDTGTGFFLGYDSTAHKFSIGNSSSEKLTFDGTNLSVTGAVNASSGDFSGQVAVGSTAGTITVIDGNDTDYRLFTNATLDTDTNQYLPDDSSFKVGNDGRVFASNITIYNDDGDVLLSPSGLGAAALNDISTTSGQVVSTVGGTVSNSTSEITLTTSSASESFTITSKVAINDNFDGTQYFSGASTSSTANAEAQLTGVDVLIDYYVKADGGSYGASPDVTKTVTIVNSGTPTSTQMRVGGFDRGSSYSGSLTRYFALLQDFGGALEIIPNSGGGATSYVVTTASLGSSLFPSAQTYKIKIVMRVVEDGTTTVISGSTTPPSSDNTTTGIYFDGGNSDERHYEITGTGLIKNSDNTFTSGSQNLLSSGGTISGSLVVTQDLTVQGTTVTLNTSELAVEDRNITLNYGTGDTSASADGAGITIQDAVNSSTDATLNWNATNDRWEFSHQMKTPSLMVGAKERIDVDGDLNNIRNINLSDTLTSAGDATFAGDVTADKYIMAGGSQIGQDYAYLKSASTTTASLTLRKDSTGADAIDFLQLRSNANGLIGKIEGDGDISFRGATFAGEVAVTDNNGVRITAPSYATLRLEEGDQTDLNTSMFNSGGDFVITTSNDARSSTTDRIRLDHATGDIGFYNAAGSHQKLFWDASVPRLQVGNLYFAEVGSNGDIIQSTDSTGLHIDVAGSIHLDADDGGHVRFKDGGTQYASIYKSGSDAVIDNTGTLTLDVEGILILNADNTGIVDFKDGGTHFGRIENASSDFKLESRVQDKDIVLVGNDGGVGVEALRLDMHDAGKAIFNAGAAFSDNVSVYGANRKILVGESGAGGTFGFIGWDDASNVLYLGNSYNSAFNKDIAINGSGHVGVGTSSPSSYYSKNLVVMADGDGTGGITIAAPATDDTTYLAFADGTSGAATYAGYLGYAHSSNSFFIGTNASTKFTILSDGKTAVGGNHSPTAALDVRISGASGKIAEFHNSTGYGVDIGSSTTEAYISSGYTQDFLFKTNAGSGQVERLRIDSNGTLLVDKQSSDIDTAGIELTYDNLIVGTRSHGVTQYLNRLNSDGDILVVMRDGSTSSGGSIGVNGTYIYVGSNGASGKGIKITDALLPATKAGAFNDNDVNLGASNVRWQNLYLSSGLRWYSGSTQKAYIAYSSSDSDVIHYAGANVGYQFWAGGNHRFTIQSDGKVAVGGSHTPGSELHVKGSDETQVWIEAPSGYNPGIRLLENGTSKWTIANDQTNDGLFFYDFGASAERLRITASGQINVGPFGGNGNAVIAGTSSPSFTNQPGTNLVLKSGDGSGTGSSYMQFFTSPAGSSGTTVNTAQERMRIDNAGRLLIGKQTSSFATAGLRFDPTNIQLTTSNNVSAYFNRLNSYGNILEFYQANLVQGHIGSKLSDAGSGDGELYFTSGNTGLFFDDVNNCIRPCKLEGGDRNNVIDLGNANNRFKTIFLSGEVKFVSTSYEDRSLGIDSTGFYLYNNADGRYDIQVDPSGNVGVGVNPASYHSAANQLVVYNDTSPAGITIVGGTTNTSNVFFADGTSGNQLYRGYVQYQHGSDRFAFGVSGDDRMFLDGSGNGTFTGNVTAYSDERLKSDIETLDGSKVLEMRGVSYTRDGVAGSGVIAQELEKHAPELVHTADDEIGTKSVAYANLTGYLIEAVKMQAKQIAELQQALEDLKNGNNKDKHD